MKAVILAGGLGTRISEESALRPKPMVEIGGQPILWHIMKIYAHHGVTDFIICLGYQGYMIKEYFANYFLHHSDVTFDFGKQDGSTSAAVRGTLECHSGRHRRSRHNTGGRLKRVGQYLDRDEPFCFTYGDGVADIDIPQLIAFHTQDMAGCATLDRGACRLAASARWISMGRPRRAISEKPQGDGGWINGGFFVLQPQVLDLHRGRRYVVGDASRWKSWPGGATHGFPS